MTPDQFARAEALFNEACGLPGDRRATWVRKQCADDPELLRKVEGMLTQDENSCVALDSPAVGAGFHVGIVDDSDERVRAEFEAIDRYRILDRVGGGGFGTVYCAEQQLPVKRIVAIKVIKRGMDTHQVIARFEAERQTLAMMQHPNIASVFDAGQTESGRAYFVMEFVAGKPVTEYCDATRLDAGERIALFMSICNAIRHAHIKGVIHRDIKPSNVMVTDGGPGEPPVPKIIDFGIAKATAAEASPNTAWTQEGQFLGTPDYMSPEQATSFDVPIDTRSDVYSLGVLLYELLTGTTPFESGALRRAGIAEFHRVMREVDPPRPSARFSASTRRSSEINEPNGSDDSLQSAIVLHAEARRSDPATLKKLLRGDLDWIVMMAMEKDPARRYQSVSDFANDLARYQANEPIVARPPTAVYRLGKFARRHRGSLAAGVAIFVILAGGIVASSLGWASAINARDAEIAERKRADDESAVARAVQEFLTDDLLSAVSPEARGHAVSMGSVLDTAAARIENRFSNQPRVELAVRLAIGSTYRALGRTSDALPHVERARELADAFLEADDSDAIKTLFELSKLQLWRANYEESEQLMRIVLERRRRVLGSRHPKTVEALTELAATLMEQHRLEDALALFREALNIAEEIVGAENELTISPMYGMALILDEQERTGDDNPRTETTELYQRVLALSRIVHGDDHPRTLLRMSGLAVRLVFVGQDDLAEPLFRDALARQERIQGRHHPGTLRTIMNIAKLEARRDHLDLAAGLLDEVTDAARKYYGPRDPSTVQPVVLLARIHIRQNRFADAEFLLTSEIERLGERAEEFPPFVAIKRSLVELYTKWGKPEKAAFWQSRLTPSS